MTSLRFPATRKRCVRKGARGLLSIGEKKRGSGGGEEDCI